MNEISAMPANIAHWLSEREELSHIKFLTEFPPVKKAVPLRKITVAVGLHSILIKDTFEQSDEEHVLESGEYCRRAEITLRFSIHAPFSLGGGACHQAFVDIIDCLSFDSGLDISESGCELIKEDRDTDALVLTARAKVNSRLCPPDTTDLVFPSFLDKTLLCGSHIRNTAIHLSENQQTWLASPFVQGAYSGMGQSTRTINLGFRPAAVFVFAGGMPSVTASSQAYSALAAGESGSLGIEITANGFRVKNGSTHAVSGITPLLNEAGTGYVYLAFRGVSA